MLLHWYFHALIAYFHVCLSLDFELCTCKNSAFTIFVFGACALFCVLGVALGA